MWCSEAGCRKHALAANRYVRGFTLLELMIVMVLLGLLAGLTLPALNRWYAALQGRSEASLVMEALRAQSFRAGALRRDLRLTERSFAPQAEGDKDIALARVPLPEGWKLRRLVGATFRANGLCDDGLVALTSSSGSALLILIQGPSCQFSWQADPGAKDAAP